MIVIMPDNEFWPVYLRLQKKNFYQNVLQKSVSWKNSFRSFFIFKKSSVKGNLRKPA